jgi:hypothetical protein
MFCQHINVLFNLKKLLFIIIGIVLYCIDRALANEGRYTVHVSDVFAQFGAHTKVFADRTEQPSGTGGCKGSDLEPSMRTTRPLAVVTGASSGIGYELAKLCVENGYDLAIAADEPSIVEAKQAFEALGASVAITPQSQLAELHRGMAEPGSGKS